MHRTASPCRDPVANSLVLTVQAGMIGAAFQAMGETRRKGSARINESKLTKGQIRKLNALRKSVGDALGEEAFGKWLAHQAEAMPRSI